MRQIEGPDRRVWMGGKLVVFGVAIWQGSHS